MTRPKARRLWPPSLRSVLLVSSLVVLLIPITALWLLRVFDTRLLRQTEAEAIGQAAVLSALFASHLEEAFLADEEVLVGVPVRQPTGIEDMSSDREPSLLRPVEPRLDLATTPLLPPAPDPARGAAPHPTTLRVGRELTNILELSQTVTLAGLRLLDHQGTVVGSSGSELLMDLGGREEVASALTGEPTSVLRQRSRDELEGSQGRWSRPTPYRVVVGFPVHVADQLVGAVLVSRTPRTAGRELSEQWPAVVVLGFTLIALVALLAIWSAALIRRPILRLTKQVEQMGRGEIAATRPLRRPGTREVERMSRVVASTTLELDRRAQSLRQFASDVAHEFKGPLATLRGSAELLSDHDGRLDRAQVLRFVELAHRSSERLASLVDRLLTLAQAEAGATSEDRCDAGASIRRALRRHGLEAFDQGDHGPVEVAVGQEVLDTVLDNLLENAKTHATTDGVAPQIRVRLTASRDVARLEVRDSGPGIEESDFERIFERFYTTSRESGGHGLGLPLVRSLVEAHGGSVGVQSRPGDTRFWVELPLTQSTIE